jgi:hypothetical protein
LIALYEVVAQIVLSSYKTSTDIETQPPKHKTQRQRIDRASHRG